MTHVSLSLSRNPSKGKNQENSSLDLATNKSKPRALANNGSLMAYEKINNSDYQSIPMLSKLIEVIILG